MGAPGMLPAINTSPPLLSIFDACSDDGWASTPTVDSLLPKIVALWEELYVPLAYRSRFFLSFRGREVFYYEVEARRLEWKRSQMLAGATEESSWAEQHSSNASHLGRGSYGYGDGVGPGTPTAGRGTLRPMTSASAAAALTASSSFGGIRRRSRQLDKAARWVMATGMACTAVSLIWAKQQCVASVRWPSRPKLSVMERPTDNAALAVVRVAARIPHLNHQAQQPNQHHVYDLRMLCSRIGHAGPLMC
jgi:hypothetical protein